MRLYAPLVWRPGEGWTDESTGAGLSASSSRDQLALGKKFLDAKDYDNALRAFNVLVRRWPYSFFAPEAQFRIAECLEKRGDFLKADKAYDKMIQKYPASSFFEQALERKLAIGNLYLAGEPQRLLGVPFGPSVKTAVDIYESIIRAAPYGRLAPIAEFQLGLARTQEKKYTEAIAAYSRILDKYPNSELADDAQYQLGYTWYVSALATAYDQSSGEKAMEAFEDYIVRYPLGDKVAAAREHLVLLKKRATLGSFNIATFYEKTRNYKAAFIYYSDVIRQNPDSEQGKIAEQKVKQLRPMVEKDLGLPTAQTASTATPLEAPSGPPPTGAPGGSSGANGP
ncbi:outer membrane protein assembly factor BamD [Methylacidimicrobium sp. B4]|nr:outer membrane protein assembly factor BamD [Methylacidimicrobium sp. B4]